MSKATPGLIKQATSADSESVTTNTNVKKDSNVGSPESRGVITPDSEMATSDIQVPA